MLDAVTVHSDFWKRGEGCWSCVVQRRPFLLRPRLFGSDVLSCPNARELMQCRHTRRSVVAMTSTGQSNGRAEKANRHDGPPARRADQPGRSVETFSGRSLKLNIRLRFLQLVQFQNICPILDEVLLQSNLVCRRHLRKWHARLGSRGPRERDRKYFVLSGLQLQRVFGP
ncbi:hypothetical protein BKA81DRAFT_367991 [Phyllosticta paracitricarpa]